MVNQLEIRNLHARIVDGEPILNGVSLVLPKGQVHAIMGPNGAGKSTLGKVIAGDPSYDITRGDILMDGESILGMEADERARKGLFLAFQYPVEVPGVSNANFLRLALQAKKGGEVNMMEFYGRLQKALATLEWDESILTRYLNDGFSGGEKKRNEIMHMMVLEPTYGIMDETDSGLDIDALKVVARGVNAMRGPNFGALLITHYQRLLNYITPDAVHVMIDGRIAASGGFELAEKLEAQGYEWVKELAVAS
jgi:Fe-S cluster assembly ATP-binding protein